VQQRQHENRAPMLVLSARTCRSVLSSDCAIMSHSHHTEAYI
jgi:hypothetical protein